MIKKALIGLLIMSSNSTWSVTKNLSCDKFYQSNLVKIYELYFQELNAIQPFWGNYRTTENLLLLTSEGFESCLIAAKDGKVQFINLPRPIEFNTYWMIDLNGANPYPFIPDEIKAIINSHNVNKALLFNIGKYIHYDMEVLNHEGFHLFFQRAKMPAWYTYVEQEILAQQCYHNELDAYKGEAELLIFAFEQMLMNNLDIAKKMLGYFLDARKNRYHRLADVRINFNGKEFTCEEAEANMEFIEGHAQFYGENATIELGLISRYDLIANYRYDLYDEEIGWLLPFYNFGSLQLHIIQEFLKEDFYQWGYNLYYTYEYSEGQLYKKIQKLLEM